MRNFLIIQPCMKSSPLNLFNSLIAGVGTELLKISCIRMIQQLHNYQAFALFVQNIKQRHMQKKVCFCCPLKSHCAACQQMKGAAQCTMGLSHSTTTLIPNGNWEQSNGNSVLRLTIGICYGNACLLQEREVVMEFSLLPILLGRQ